MFNKKEEGENDVYACFCVKLQVAAKDVISRVSFKFNFLGSSKIFKKPMQGMETKPP